MLICNICETKAKYQLDIDFEKMMYSLYFCKNHKPIGMNGYILLEDQGKDERFKISMKKEEDAITAIRE